MAAYIGLTQYSAKIPAPAAFAPSSLNNVLGEYLAKNGKTQLRIAETEKYAHVTFFFSGAAKSRSKAKSVSSSHRQRSPPMTCSPR